MEILLPHLTLISCLKMFYSRFLIILVMILHDRREEERRREEEKTTGRRAEAVGGGEKTEGGREAAQRTGVTGEGREGAEEIGMEVSLCISV